MKGGILISGRLNSAFRGRASLGFVLKVIH